MLKIPAVFFIISSRSKALAGSSMSIEMLKEILEFRDSNDRAIYDVQTHSHDSHNATLGIGLERDSGESEELYRTRLESDFEAAIDFFQSHLGYSPTMLALPFGRGIDSTLIPAIASNYGIHLIRGVTNGGIRFKGEKVKRVEIGDVFSETDIRALDSCFGNSFSLPGG